MMTYALYLEPKQDLMKALNAFVKQKQLKASYIFTCAGSLTRAVLGPPSQPGPATYEGQFEIISLVGTLGPSGADLELSISDASGNTIDGRLLPGCAIGRSAEIILSELSGGFSAQSLIPRTGDDALAFIQGAD